MNRHSIGRPGLDVHKDLDVITLEVEFMLCDQRSKLQWVDHTQEKTKHRPLWDTILELEKLNLLNINA